MARKSLSRGEPHVLNLKLV